jgi:hypothetical protein
MEWKPRKKPLDGFSDVSMKKMHSDRGRAAQVKQGFHDRI